MAVRPTAVTQGRRRWSSTSACRSRRATSSRSSATTNTRSRPRRRRGVRRARRLAGDHEQRDAGAARPRRHALPDGAAARTCTRRWSPRTRSSSSPTSSGRTASRTSTRSRSPARANGKIASVEPGMGAWGLTVEEHRARRQQRARDAMAALEGIEAGARHRRERHRLHGHDRGPPRARGHARSRSAAR